MRHLTAMAILLLQSPNACAAQPTMTSGTAMRSLLLSIYTPPPTAVTQDAKVSQLVGFKREPRQRKATPPATAPKMSNALTDVVIV
jgi:hypothetical protein